MNENNQPSPMSYYFLVLVEVVFATSAGVAVLKRQIFEKSDIDVFPAERIHRLNNVAALQVRQSLDADGQASFQALDAFILSVVPLGRMTHEAFWQGIEPPPMDGAAEAPVAAGETAAADTAPVETAAPSNIHEIRPGATELPPVENPTESFHAPFQDEPVAPSEVGPDPVDSGLEGHGGGITPAPQDDYAGPQN